MTRTPRSYTEVPRRQAMPPAAGADVSQPEAGFYRGKLRGGAVRVGIEIRYGAPLDPVTGDELDRGHRWMAFANGDLLEDFDAAWPACCGEPISEADYRAFCAWQRWARENAPRSAWADPRRRIDPLSTDNPSLF